MDSIKNKVNVRIGGNDYTLVGVECEEHIQRVAMYIDKKMNQVTRSNNRLSTSMAAVLCAINIGDDFCSLKDQAAELDKIINEANEELEVLRADVGRLNAEKLLLEKRNTNLQVELARREAELSEVRNTLDNNVKQRMYIAK